MKLIVSGLSQGRDCGESDRGYDGDVDTSRRIKACGSGMNGGWQRENESLRV